MLKSILPVAAIAAAWMLGSYVCYRSWGTGAILPYAGATIAAAALYVWRANRQPRA